MRWILSPLVMALGIVIMKYTVQITNFTGPIDFAERYIKMGGGTYLFWRLFGLLIVIGGLLWLTGIIDVQPGNELVLPTE